MCPPRRLKPVLYQPDEMLNHFYHPVLYELIPNTLLQSLLIDVFPDLPDTWTLPGLLEFTVAALRIANVRFEVNGALLLFLSQCVIRVHNQ